MRTHLLALTLAAAIPLAACNDGSGDKDTDTEDPITDPDTDGVDSDDTDPPDTDGGDTDPPDTDGGDTDPSDTGDTDRATDSGETDVDDTDLGDDTGDTDVLGGTGDTDVLGGTGDTGVLDTVGSDTLGDTDTDTADTDVLTDTADSDTDGLADTDTGDTDTDTGDTDTGDTGLSGSTGDTSGTGFLGGTGDTGDTSGTGDTGFLGDTGDTTVPVDSAAPGDTSSSGDSGLSGETATPSDTVGLADTADTGDSGVSLVETADTATDTGVDTDAIPLSCVMPEFVLAGSGPVGPMPDPVYLGVGMTGVNHLNQISDFTFQGQNYNASITFTFYDAAVQPLCEIVYDGSLSSPTTPWPTSSGGQLYSAHVFNLAQGQGSSNCGTVSPATFGSIDLRDYVESLTVGVGMGEMVDLRTGLQNAVVGAGLNWAQDWEPFVFSAYVWLGGATAVEASYVFEYERTCDVVLDNGAGNLVRNGQPGSGPLREYYQATPFLVFAL